MSAAPAALVAEVEAAEAALRAAQIAGDATAMAQLLAEELVYTTQVDEVLDKRGQLAAYRSGRLKLTRIDNAGRTIRFIGTQAAVVTVRAELAGHVEGTAFVGAYRYTRVWRRGDNGWQLLASHCSGVS